MRHNKRDPSTRQNKKIPGTLRAKGSWDKMTDVFLNEIFAGDVENPEQFVKTIREKRREGKFPHTMNLQYDSRSDSISIQLSTGRAIRPLIIVEDGKPKITKEHIEKLNKNELTFSGLVREGLIEYLDALEEENALIAVTEEELTKDHTHMEIGPAVILGLVTSLVPYANFGSASRLIRGSKMQKQAL